ncbi:MAG: hypothetical protein AAGC81_17810 [Pseudomonadota bacterium]
MSDDFSERAARISRKKSSTGSGEGVVQPRRQAGLFLLLTSFVVGALLSLLLFSEFDEKLHEIIKFGIGFEVLFAVVVFFGYLRFFGPWSAVVAMFFGMICSCVFFLFPYYLFFT